MKKIKQKNFKTGSKNFSTPKILTFSSFHIKRNICRAHTVTSNIIFHILFNKIYDVIICIKIVWSILDVMRMRDYKGTSHCMSLLT